MRILLVDDDPQILEPLEIALQREGYVVLTANSGIKGWEVFMAERPDFALLDVTMPGMDGIALLRRIRQTGPVRVPVIMLTGRSHEREKVTGLDQGADDYVTKPCSQRELIARIRAVWRRAGQSTGILKVGTITMDPGTREATIGGKPLDLTVIEFSLLLALMERAGQVVRVSALMKQVWGAEVSHDLLRVTVFRLRRKIEPDPKKPHYIHTINGVGFILRDGISPPRSSTDTAGPTIVS